MDSTRTILEKRLHVLKEAKYAAMRRAARPFDVEIDKIEKMLEIYGSDGFNLETKGVSANAQDDFGDLQLNLWENGTKLKPRDLTRKIGMNTQSMILEILREQRGGMLALDILEEINRRWALGLVRTSLSPQLSRLKQKGEVHYRDGFWFYKEENK